MKPKVTIKSIKVLEQHEQHTVLGVQCRYCDYDYSVKTELGHNAEAHYPQTTLDGYTVPPSDEFVLALHEAIVLDTAHVELLSNEWDRISK